MNQDRRSFERRETEVSAIVAAPKGEVLDASARVLNLSVGGVRLASGAELAEGGRYSLKLEDTETWFEVSVIERVDGSYRCKIETDWDDLHDVIRQSDDLTLLILHSSENEAPDA